MSRGRAGGNGRVDSRARGKRARELAPRSSHGKWSPAADRRDAVAILEAQAGDRVAELVPIRYGRMLASPFAFFRGAAAVMAADLAATPRSGITVQLCGDAHLANFGAFAAPDRSLVFDVNDFDETLPGPWEWDVKRLVASVEIAGRDREFGRKQRVLAVQAAAGEYREQIRRLAKMGNLEAWYQRVDVELIRERHADEVDEAAIAVFDRNVAKAKRKTSARAFAKLIREVDGELRIVSDPPLITPLAELLDDDALAAATGDLRRILGEYRASLPQGLRKLLDRYRLVDMARKVVGVGSVGTRAWIVLLLGRDGDDPLFLQVKEAQRSVLEPHAGRSIYARQGRRVVEGQRLMQASGDILLGWTSVDGVDGRRRDYYVRQLWDAKGSARIDLMAPRTLAVYARLCGGVLANAHARSGDRVAIASYLGGGDHFDRAMVEFAARYADRNEEDHAALLAAAGSGRIRADVS
ncbi:MAG TPA: DUF2252 domain-containing protein [Solirubrobacterales bacterium]|nr:DUF2252 domain-containing protein [Solirubrobacterales bacterium]